MISEIMTSEGKYFKADRLVGVMIASNADNKLHLLDPSTGKVTVVSNTHQSANPLKVEITEEPLSTSHDVTLSSDFLAKYTLLAKIQNTGSFLAGDLTTYLGFGPWSTTRGFLFTKKD